MAKTIIIPDQFSEENLTELKIVNQSKKVTMRIVGQDDVISINFRVARLVTSPRPHRPVRAAFPHTVPPNQGFAKE